MLEAWSHILTVGQPLPTLPLWLSANSSFPSIWSRVTSKRATICGSRKRWWLLPRLIEGKNDHGQQANSRTAPPHCNQRSQSFAWAKDDSDRLLDWISFLFGGRSNLSCCLPVDTFQRRTVPLSPRIGNHLPSEKSPAPSVPFVAASNLHRRKRRFSVYGPESCPQAETRTLPCPWRSPIDAQPDQNQR